jgi:hypothetical protein
MGFEEDISDYRRFSLAADSILSAGSMVNAGQIPGDEVLRNFAFANRPLTIDLMAFPRFATRTGRVPERFLLESARLRIGQEVNFWIQVSQTGPRLEWDHRRKAWAHKMRHSTLGVLGAVALALFTSVPESQGWLLCSICPQVYKPERAPTPGRQHYCPECRKSPEMWRRLKSQARARAKESTE